MTHLDSLAIVLILGLVAATSGCGEPQERHTWGELGWVQIRDGRFIADPTPVPPELWDELQAGDVLAAPEEPTRVCRPPRQVATAPAPQLLQSKSAETKDRLTAAPEGTKEKASWDYGLISK